MDTKSVKIFGAIAIVIVAGLILGRLAWVNKDAIFEANEQSQIIQDEASKDNNESTNSEIEGPKTTQTLDEELEVTEHQTELKNDYSQNELSFIELLSGQLWSASSETKFLMFGENSFTVVVDGQNEMTGTYALSTLNSEQIATEDDVLNRYSATIETDQGTYPLTLDVSISDSNSMSLACDVFAPNPTTWIRSAKAENVEVTGCPDEFGEYINNDYDGLTYALNSFTSAKFPSVTQASFNGSVTYDFEDRVATFGLTLQNSARTQVSVDYDQSLGTFVVSTLR
jgi:hypothetical protein